MKYSALLLTVLILLTNCNPPSINFQKIEFQADACFGECPVFNMTINSDGSASYDANMFNERQGQFKTTIKQNYLDSLKTLINNADIFSLKDNYSTTWTDHPTYTLTVILNKDSTKKIVDYGPGGPDKLTKIYKQIFSLRQSQDWK